MAQRFPGPGPAPGPVVPPPNQQRYPQTPNPGMRQYSQQSFTVIKFLVDFVEFLDKCIWF